MSGIAAVTAEGELQRVLSDGLSGLLGDEDLPPIESIEIQPCRRRTSFPLDELTVTLVDGRSVHLLRKRFSRSALAPNAAAAKHADLFDPNREIEVYRTILANARLGTAAFIGAGFDSRAAGPWLVLEHVHGVELYQVGAIEEWCAAAAWLATMHERLIWATGDTAAARARLLRQEPDRWLQAMRRAQEIGLGTAPARTRQRLATAHRAVVSVLERLPIRLLHGDAYASNILVNDPCAPRRVCAVDWEMASVGPALFDLAALIAGNWSAEEGLTIAASYLAALPASSPWRLDRSRFEVALEACRFQVAVQWLGWQQDWTPPPEHRQDWLAAATVSLQRLGL